MKGWSLLNKDTGKIIKIAVQDYSESSWIYAEVFEKKKDLLEAIDSVEHGEEVRRVEVTVIEK